MNDEAPSTSLDQCTHIESRSGSRRLVDVPAAVVSALESGAPSRNHIEQMAIDQGQLLAALFPDLSHRAKELRSPRFLSRLRAGATVMLDEFGVDVLQASRSWGSDTARGWGAFAVDAAATDVAQAVELAVPFAADQHFAVREWAWLGIRSKVCADPAGALKALEALIADPSASVRRFAVEASRPRGVWSRHIPLLAAEPTRGERLLESLAADPSRYVQDSVANWVNDAAKSHPVWARHVVLRWSGRGDVSDYVLRRAQRSLPQSPGDALHLDITSRRARSSRSVGFVIRTVGDAHGGR